MCERCSDSGEPLTKVPTDVVFDASVGGIKSRRPFLPVLRDWLTKVSIYLPGRGPADSDSSTRHVARLAKCLLATRYAPPAVVVNERFDVVHFQGGTGAFLEAPLGVPQLNVVSMARPGLAEPLRMALRAASAQALTIRTQGLRITQDEASEAEAQTIFNLEVIPIPGNEPRTASFFLVVFEKVGNRFHAREALSNYPPVHESIDELSTRIDTELSETRHRFQALAREGRGNAGELRGANDELTAGNEELQSAANDLANILESVQIPIIMVDGGLRVRHFTPAARDVSNLLPGDVGRSMEDLRFKVELDDLCARIRETIRSSTPSECDVQSLDGQWFRLHIRPYRTTDGRFDGAILSFLDVDFLKRTAEDAERARDYAQSIVETLPMSPVVFDERLRIVSANPTFFQAFAPHFVATAPTALLGRDGLDVPALREAIVRSLATGTPFRGLEIAYALPMNGQRELLVAGCPMHAANGDLMLLVVLEDVTERHVFEASEKRARIEAEQASSAKDFFLACVSHELRTPLSTILISADVLQKAALKDPTLGRIGDAIERAAGTQAKLLDDLLDISRIISGKLMLDLQAVDLAAVVTAAVDVTRPMAEAKGLRLELTIDGPVRSIFGDPARLQQVVANLAGNAIKFTPAGGKITIELEARDGKARLTVRDTGVGLMAEHVPRLFDRFVQTESLTTRPLGGLGLGLAIVRHIVDLHGGEVTADSPGEGKGSTFTVTLPLSAKIWHIPSPVRRAVTASIRGVQVLLIEDDQDTREICTSMLEGQGAHVHAVHSGGAAWEALEKFCPQVILCDVAMPGEDGYTFIRKLRCAEAGRAVPAAAFTAFAGEEDRRLALESGFQMHLPKPVDSGRLVRAVATLAAWREKPLNYLYDPHP